MKIKTAKGIAILDALGVSGAETLPPAKLVRKLNDLPNIVGDEVPDLEDGDLDGTFKKCLEALEEGGKITLSDAEAAEAAETAAPKKKVKAKPAEEAVTEAPKKKKAKGAPQTTATPGGAGVKKTKKKGAETKKKKAAKATPTPAPEPKASKGFREDARTRPLIAGILLKQHGIENGITPELVAAIDNAYGKENPRETKFTLRNAIHAIRGFKMSEKAAAEALAGPEEEAED